jgi:hypothetical protein
MDDALYDQEMRVRLPGHVAHIGEKLNTYSISVGSHKENYYLKDLNGGGRLLL